MRPAVISIEQPATTTRADATGAEQRTRVIAGISIRVSTLEPRYCLLQRERITARLTPAVLELARRAAEVSVSLTLDAEHTEHLELSLDIIEALVSDVTTRQWTGLSFTVQAYDRRCIAFIDWLASLAHHHRRRLAVRLVKGAYWKFEIGRAQCRGLSAYPVFTRQCHTEIAYLACATRLFAHLRTIFPQLATQNALSISSILELAPAGALYEFQRHHGLAAVLYDEAKRRVPDFPNAQVFAVIGDTTDLSVS